MMQGVYQKRPGESCNRDCIKDTENYTCSFNFTLEQKFTDSEGRFADGFNRSVLLYNNILPGPSIIVCEGDNVVVNLKNELTGDVFLLGAPFNAQGNEYLDTWVPFNSTTLHFHGIRQKQPDGTSSWSPGGPWSDGVPLVSQCPIYSGDIFTYQFFGSGGINSGYNNAPAGTYWYHSHLGRQRMNGAQGKLIIMPRKKDDYIDVDKPENSLFLQEWYTNTTDATPRTLLVNGKGRQPKTYPELICNDPFLHIEPFPHTVLPCFEQFKEGYLVDFMDTDNPNYGTGENLSYEVFDVEADKKYRFRIIGGIGDNIPIRVSIEEHTFTVIATDSIDIHPAENVDALWVAAGERYDIVINTKKNPQRKTPYKINVVHIKTSKNGRKHAICSLAWLKYSSQTVDENILADCNEMAKLTFKKVLNPVPDDYLKWGKKDHIFPKDLTSKQKPEGIKTILNTQYVDMYGMKFNNFSMSFPLNYSEVPVLFQDPSSSSLKRCGPVCGSEKNSCETVYSNCPKKPCKECLHVVQQPWNPYGLWFETVLINVKIEEGLGVAHPIHQHGGWFNVVGMDQFNYTINREMIIEMDKDCKQGYQCLQRNLENPIFKDVIQVPTNGYVIIRTPIDNRGAWIVHCHINWHVEHGMAMVFQIGNPDNWAMGPDESRAAKNSNRNCKN